MRKYAAAKGSSRPRVTCYNAARLIGDNSDTC